MVMAISHISRPTSWAGDKKCSIVFLLNQSTETNVINFATLQYQSRVAEVVVHHQRDERITNKLDACSLFIGYYTIPRKHCSRYKDSHIHDIGANYDLVQCFDTISISTN